MSTCLNGVKRIIRSIDVEKVTMQELRQMCQPRLVRQFPGAFQLVGIAVYSHAVCIGKKPNLQ